MRIQLRRVFVVNWLRVEAENGDTGHHIAVAFRLLNVAAQLEFKVQLPLQNLQQPQSAHQRRCRGMLHSALCHCLSKKPVANLRHVDDTLGQGLVAEDGAILVPLPALQAHVQLVATALQQVRVLQREVQLQLRVQQAARWQHQLVGAQRALQAL